MHSAQTSDCQHIGQGRVENLEEKLGEAIPSGQPRGLSQDYFYLCFRTPLKPDPATDDHCNVRPCAISMRSRTRACLKYGT